MERQSSVKPGQVAKYLTKHPDVGHLFAKKGVTSYPLPAAALRMEEMTPEQQKAYKEKADTRAQRLLSGQPRRSSQAVRRFDSASSYPPQNGGKTTHVYKNKEYMVRTGSKGGKYIVVGGKEKRKVYV